MDIQLAHYALVVTTHYTVRRQQMTIKFAVSQLSLCITKLCKTGERRRKINVCRRRPLCIEDCLIVQL